MFRALVFVLFVHPVLGQNSLQFSIVNDSENTDYQINVLRFYISSVSFTYADGIIEHESNSYHLIDIEDSSSLVIPLRTLSPSQHPIAVTFTVGTDSLINVSGIMEGDLDPIKGMYWAWNSGYINFKIEGRNINIDPPQEFEFHLGGYLLPYTTARTLTFPIKGNAEKLHIELNIHDFLDGIDLVKQHEVLIPGKEAALLSDRLSTAFSIHE